MSTTFSCKDIGIKNPEFVAKAQFLSRYLESNDKYEAFFISHARE